jgi:acylphosphatase
MSKVRKHVLIKGRVQGVCFRSYTQEEALANNVFGWVRNTYDGHVEAVFEGDTNDVDRVITWCHRGPSLAHVKSVDVETRVYTGEFDTFSITY